MATRVKQGLLFAYRRNAFAIKIPMGFVSALCGSEFLQFPASELPGQFPGACLHFCHGGDVHLRLREIRAFMFAMKAQRAAAPR